MASRGYVSRKDIEMVLRYYADYAPDEVEDETDIVRMIREYRSKYGDQYLFHIMSSGRFHIPEDDYDRTSKKLTEFYRKYDPKKARDEEHKESIVDRFWWKHGVNYSAPLWRHVRDQYRHPPATLERRLNKLITESHDRYGYPDEDAAEVVSRYWASFGSDAEKKLVRHLTEKLGFRRPPEPAHRYVPEGGLFPQSIEGAKTIIWYEDVHGSKVLVIGENHNNKGTGVELMEYLRSFDDGRCFDVYVEMPHHWVAPRRQVARGRAQLGGGMLGYMQHYHSHHHNTRPGDRIRWHSIDARGSLRCDDWYAGNPFMRRRDGTVPALAALFSVRERIVLFTGLRYLLDSGAGDRSYARLLRTYSAAFAKWERSVRGVLGRVCAQEMSPGKLAIRRQRLQKSMGKFLKKFPAVEAGFLAPLAGGSRPRRAVPRHARRRALSTKIKGWVRATETSLTEGDDGQLPMVSDLFAFFRMFTDFEPHPDGAVIDCPMQQRDIVYICGEAHAEYLEGLIRHVFGIEPSKSYKSPYYTYTFRNNQRVRLF